MAAIAAMLFSMFAYLRASRVGASAASGQHKATIWRAAATACAAVVMVSAITTIVIILNEG